MRWLHDKPRALPRDQQNLLRLIDGARTPADLAQLLFPHLEEAGLAKVLGLLADLKQAGFIT